ncbi:MAG: DEAD/DEAH box helicase [Desulfococcus sp. 4484_241]|nr:MAG: DEAD/DEAH box helicase [Desulfococcus sp. 4484_241]
MGKEDRKGDIGEYVHALVKSPIMGPDVVFHKVLDPVPGRLLFPPFQGYDDLFGAIAGVVGIKGLYTHQASGIERVLAKNSVVVATPTASGKTLVYNIPVLKTLLENPRARALYLFPLKALARDQQRVFEGLAAAVSPSDPPSAAIYDGDTSAWRRRKIRSNPPAVIMTNPDMLHLAFLPHHEVWRPFFENLRFVVIDEIHTYRGVMGSHMAHVFRRLLRICRHYGSDPVFVAGSATISNPAELAEKLTGRRIEALTESGAPRGRRHVVFLNPSTGPASAAIQLLKAAVYRNLRTIVYTQSRKLAELISIWINRKGNARFDRISSYRAGLLPSQRRDIEAKLASGELLAVVSTSALELGIDIGDLDLCLLVGYPGSAMATWQRGGRVGRSGQESAMILVAGDDALDQYFMRNPSEFINRQPEAAVINPDNPVIVEKHLLCAAAEQPLDIAEPFMEEESIRKAVHRMETRGELLRSADGRRLFTSRKRPHRDVDLRGVGKSFRIVCSSTGEHIGDIDGHRVFRDAHPGAVYLHMGKTWVIQDIDVDSMRVKAARKNVAYYTRHRSRKETRILETASQKEIAGITVCEGRLKVTETITGYEKLRLYAGKKMGIEPLDLPPIVFETRGFWMVIPSDIQERAEKEYRHFMGGIHAIEHAVIGVLPAFVMCDRNDLGGISMTFHTQVGAPVIFIYDAVAGGIGLSRQAYTRVKDILEFTKKIIAQCPCRRGCPSCVHSPKCGSGNRPIDKGCALYLLEEVLSSRKANVGVARTVQGDAVRAQPGKTVVRDPAPVKRPSRFAVFDIETRRSAAEVGGWHRADRMGISCIVLYDSAADEYTHFLEEQARDFIRRLSQFDLVIGFNNKRFDNKVLSAFTDADLSALPTLDILDEVHKTIGYRLSLDSLAGTTLGVKKSADGLQALRWWKQGKIEKIIEYCKKDVEITRDLYLYGRKHGYLLFTNKAKQKVRLPVSW